MELEIFLLKDFVGIRIQFRKQQWIFHSKKDIEQDQLLRNSANYIK